VLSVPEQMLLMIEATSFTFNNYRHLGAKVVDAGDKLDNAIQNLLDNVS